jgi:hypothetical protein
MLMCVFHINGATMNRKWLMNGLNLYIDISRDYGGMYGSAMAHTGAD